MNWRLQHQAGLLTTQRLGGHFLLVSEFLFKVVARAVSGATYNENTSDVGAILIAHGASAPNLGIYSNFCANEFAPAFSGSFNGHV
ncbi:hypothetical protein [Pelotomaculum schinkii]|uniref:hypothetical protein n=1 Tax=Pelotomaculum schinkii TaxID=78350 RepID=UPI00167DBE97|nr:hypothetical protein [Pelotomaculum schinkii]